MNIQEIWEKITGWFRPPKKEEPKRIEYLDAYRGLWVSLMILVNFFLFFKNIPLWLKHAPPLGGVTIVDIGAPLFMFFIGIFYAFSFERRLKIFSLSKTVQHFITRYLVFWIFGFIGVLVTTYQLTFGWNVFMAIGLAGIYALPFMFFNHIWRLILGILLLAIYQFVILRYFQGTVLAYDMGGFLGAISWAGLILISSFWWPLIKKDNHTQFTWTGLIFIMVILAIGFAIGQFYPANKPLVDASYILLSYGIGIGGLLLSHWLGEIKKVPWKILEVMGRNTLFLYIASGIITLVLQGWVGPNIAGPLVVFDGLLIYGICLGIAYWMDYRKLYIKL